VLVGRRLAEPLERQGLAGAIIARVRSRISSRSIPLRKIAIVMADICSSAT